MPPLTRGLLDQIDAALYDLQDGQFTTINDYLEESYKNGYVGTFYSMKVDAGIPLVLPIRQDQVVKAIKTNSKLSKNLYDRLREDVNYLKRSIRAELSRGITNGSTWNQMATKIAVGMNSPFNRAHSNAVRIARTEGHRIQNEAALDGMYGAKKKGADVVKQWDATLDGRTRDEHRVVDGQIRELDEPFDVGGEKMGAPGVGGSARNVCNCRCCLLQRAKWALDDDELDTLKERAEFFGLDKTKDFEDYKNKYLTANRTLNVPEINDKVIVKAQKEFREILKRSDGIKNHIFKMSMYSEFTSYERNDEASAPFQYSSGDDVIYYNPKAPCIELYDLNYVQAHELTHRMDMLEYESYNNPKFLDAVTACRKKVLENQQRIQSWFQDGGKYENDFAISDIISALSLNEIKVPVGHKNSYWDDDANVALEIFANISSIDVMGNASKIEFETTLQELYEGYREIVG